MSDYTIEDATKRLTCLALELPAAVYDDAVKPTLAFIEQQEKRTNYSHPPVGWEWKVTENTTPSGKSLFKCSCCGLESPTPDKWQYHADVCLMTLGSKVEQQAAEIERLREEIQNAGYDLHACEAMCTAYESAEKRLEAEIERLRDEVGAYLPDMMGDLKNITSLHVDRDRWKAKAEWLAEHGDFSEYGIYFEDALQAAEEATK